MNALSGLREALGWLTVLPVRPSGSADPVPWFSWVGALLGATAIPVALVVRALAPGDLGALLAGVAVVTTWSVSAGMLHLDGLADAADALVGVRSRDERLRIMRDSRIGSYGAAALVLTIMTTVSAAAVVIAQDSLRMLLFAPVVARFSAAAALGTLPAARPEGLAYALARPRPAWSHLIAVAPVALAASWAFSESPTAVGIGLAAALVVPRLLAHRIKGITGDTLGAGIATVECLVLLVGALSSR